MKSHTVQPPSGAVMPWIGSPRQFAKDAKAKLHCDSLLIGLVDTHAPQTDTWLALAGTTANQISQWCESDFKHDPLFKEVRRKGSAQGKTAKAHVGPPLPHGQHVIVQTLPASLDRKTLWYLAAGRKNKPTDAMFQHQAASLLKLVQVEFDHIPEPGMGRLLLGADHRLIHADPQTQLRWVQAPAGVEQLIELLPAVIAQRWDKIDDQMPHDAMFDLDGASTWARFSNFAPGPAKDSGVYVELRPAEEGDVLAVGLVPDTRIAKAMAYLTDHYAQAPNLNEVAAAVHISPFHFHRLFSRQVRLSPKHFLLSFRLQIAKWMLRASRTPVGAISQATGFSSHGHFTATFHRTVGTSPTTYRSK